MNSDTKILVSIFFATLAIIIGGIFLLNKENTTPISNQKADEALLVKEDSIKISTPSAQVTLVEFADFQCPACSAYHPLVKQLLQEFNGKINFVYRHFPLDQHKTALPASYAAEAALKQNKFWEMYDLLYQKQTEWSDKSNYDEIFTGYAQSLKLNLAQFKKDFADSIIKTKVAQDRNDGLALGVNSTPTFFLNGSKLNNPASYDAFKAIVNGEIAKNLPPENSAPVHLHFDIKLSVVGETVDFSQSKYQSDEEGKELDDKVHVHNGNGKIGHVHASGVTLGYFLNTLKFKLDNECLEIDDGGKFCKKDTNILTVFVNGKEINNFSQYVFKDLDKILVYYGSNEEALIQKELLSVSDEACIYSEKCPERGTPPEEKCVGGLGTDCQE